MHIITLDEAVAGSPTERSRTIGSVTAYRVLEARTVNVSGDAAARVGGRLTTISVSADIATTARPETPITPCP